MIHLQDVLFKSILCSFMPRLGRRNSSLLSGVCFPGLRLQCLLWYNQSSHEHQGRPRLSSPLFAQFREYFLSFVRSLFVVAAWAEMVSTRFQLRFTLKACKSTNNHIIHVYIHVHTYVHIHLYIHIHTHIDIYAHICAYIYIRIYIYKYLHTYIHISVYTYKHANVYMYF